MIRAGVSLAQRSEGDDRGSQEALGQECPRQRAQREQPGPGPQGRREPMCLRKEESSVWLRGCTEGRGTSGARGGLDRSLCAILRVWVFQQELEGHIEQRAVMV